MSLLIQTKYHLVVLTESHFIFSIMIFEVVLHRKNIHNIYNEYYKLE